MSILPIKILISDKRKFQEIALLVERPEFRKEVIRLAKKWRKKSNTFADKQYQKDLFSSLTKLKLPNSLYELLSECVLSGFLWKDYDLSGLELLGVLSARSKKSKTLANLARDRDWYLRHENGEGYGEIAKRHRIEGHMVGTRTVINAIKRYKEMTGNR